MNDLTILQQILTKLDSFDDRFNKIDNRFDKIDDKLNKVELDRKANQEDIIIAINSVITAVDNVNNDTKEIKDNLDRVIELNNLKI